MYLNSVLQFTDFHGNTRLDPMLCAGRTVFFSLQQEKKMHSIVAIVYAIIIWMSLMAYTVIAGGFWPIALIAGPLTISSLTVGLLAADMLVARVSTRFGHPVAGTETH